MQVSSRLGAMLLRCCCSSMTSVRGRSKLRSAEVNKLLILWSDTSFGQRSFGTSVPTAWNDSQCLRGAATKHSMTSYCNCMKKQFSANVWSCCASLCGSFLVSGYFCMWNFYLLYSAVKVDTLFHLLLQLQIIAIYVLRKCVTYSCNLTTTSARNCTCHLERNAHWQECHKNDLQRMSHCMHIPIRCSEKHKKDSHNFSHSLVFHSTDGGCESFLPRDQCTNLVLQLFWELLIQNVESNWNAKNQRITFICTSVSNNSAVAVPAVFLWGNTNRSILFIFSSSSLSDEPHRWLA